MPRNRRPGCRTRRGRRGSPGAVLAALLAPLLTIPLPGLAAAEPWRLDEALRTGDGFTLNGSQRTRYSRLFHQFRPGLGTGDEAVSLQTLLRAEARLGDFGLVAELQDSQALGADGDSAVTTSVVNALEPIQAHVAYRRADLFGTGSDLELKLGRQTLDIGSRRLIARNRFRNAIQSFSGLSGHWRGQGGTELRAVFVLPLIPRPADRPGVLDNDAELDDVDYGFRAWGLHLQRPDVLAGGSGEAYLISLHETDDPGRLETRNRRLQTIGLRLYREPRPGSWDFDIENALQWGRRRATPLPADTRDLDAFARFHHWQVGYTFPALWSPRLTAESDFATGDRDPGDDEFDRFDTLFGPGRADFGPTDFYGLLGRENLRSAGLRLTIQPGPSTDAFVSWRINWLDSRRDFFARTGVRDPDGASGRFGGHQLELRLRHWLLPGNLRWEGGAVWFRQGEFLNDAPAATGNGNPLFFYTDLTFTF